MRRLAEAGLTTREACGNSVRNITACPYAGVAADEAFDVTPYAEALTRYLLRHPLSSTLPRKFKIAFEGCPDDHAVTAINDIGWRARVEIVDGVPRARLPRDRRGRHVDLCEVRRRAVRLPARGRDARGRGGHPARLPPARGLQAQAEEPDEVPRPLARVRGVAGRVREGARARPGRRRRALVPRRRAPTDRDRARLGAPGTSIRRRVGEARRLGGGARPRHHPRRPDAVARAERRLPRMAGDECPAPEAGRVRARRRHRSPSAISPAPSSA
jgi:hypothetical protein